MKTVVLILIKQQTHWSLEMLEEKSTQKRWTFVNFSPLSNDQCDSLWHIREPIHCVVSSPRTKSFTKKRGSFVRDWFLCMHVSKFKIYKFKKRERVMSARDRGNDDLIELHTDEYALLPSVNDAEDITFSSLSADSYMSEYSVQECEWMSRANRKIDDIRAWYDMLYGVISFLNVISWWYCIWVAIKMRFCCDCLSKNWWMLCNCLIMYVMYVWQLSILNLLEKCVY